MHTWARLRARQLWDLPTTTTAEPDAHCTPFSLPSDGVISIASDYVITLTANAVFSPQCTGGTINTSGPSTVADLDDPFYASTIPLTYVVAAATVLGWVLVIMLTITPRTFFTSSGGSASIFNRNRGIIGGANGAGNSLAGVGSRPWLQLVAALTVAVSLTIATADTFKVAKSQYQAGYMDAVAMREEVEGSPEVRITRVISDIFLWLAQVQTLIRLFPRHKEKILIKWIGFALIVLDTVFSCLNSFLIDSQRRPRDFVDAIPALSYLFELSLGLLYAAWVIYYALTKRRYAFYHYRMRNISLVALLSLIAILTPVVFFVTDVTVPDIAEWGDYFRWVGAAAASVVVWEWVERIEALERDERKDGILGREIFDGDEMLDVTPSEQVAYTRRRKDNQSTGGGGGGNTTQNTGTQQHGLNGVAHRLTRTRTKSNVPNSQITPGKVVTFGTLPHAASGNQRGMDGGAQPHTVVPPSRAETTSAASTVYVVHHNGAPDLPQPVRRRADAAEPVNVEPGDTSQEVPGPQASETEIALARRRPSQAHWHGVMNPFKRKRTTPPAEVRAAMEATREGGVNTEGVSSSPQHPSRWNVKARLGAFAADQSGKLSDRVAGRNSEVDLPWTVIPVQARGAAAWSPQLLNTDKQDDRTLSLPSGTMAVPSPTRGDRRSTPSHQSGSGSSRRGVRLGEHELSALSPAHSSAIRIDAVSPSSIVSGQAVDLGRAEPDDNG